MSLGGERPPKVCALAKIREQAKGVHVHMWLLPKELKAPYLEKGQLPECQTDVQLSYVFETRLFSKMFLIIYVHSNLIIL